MFSSRVLVLDLDGTRPYNLKKPLTVYVYVNHASNEEKITSETLTQLKKETIRLRIRRNKPNQ